jgi:hypothetical protein
MTSSFIINTYDAYPTIKDHIRSGDILLCSGNRPFSKLIQKATQSRWSHVGFILWIEDFKQLMVLEAVESHGVRIVPLQGYIDNYNGSGKPYGGDLMIGRHIHFNKDNIHGLAEFGSKLFGYPYDYGDIAKIAFRLSLRAAGYKKRHQILESSDAYICSEYAYLCYQKVGTEIAHDKLNGFIMPADFAADKNIEKLFLLRVPI